MFVDVQNSDVHLPITCRLLGIDKEQMQYWLCNRKIVTANEVLTKPLTVAQVTTCSPVQVLVIGRLTSTVSHTCLYHVTVSLSILTAIFPGEPGLAGFIEAKDDGSSGDN